MPIAASFCRAFDHAFDCVCGPASNPLKQLGALATGLFGLVAATGVVLYVVFDTSVAGAYRSIDAFSQGPGSLVRGLHRYGADAFVLVTLAHLAREWLLGRFQAFRRFVWLTGVPLLPLLFVTAIVGFWLNWDRLAQYSATATAEWLDALPLFALPVTRNFLTGVTDRLFSLLVFAHVGIPLLLVFGLWLHVQRLGRPRVVPARAVAIGTAVSVLALAWLLPVRSQAPADLATVSTALALDWFVLFWHPLADAASPAVAWALAAGALAVLFAMPYLSRRTVAPDAAVDPAHCNGCRRCVDDCPFSAITLVAHTNGRPGLAMAQVDALRCAACGICVGSCPSATPVKGRPLAPGIDLPGTPLAALQRRLADGLAQQPGAQVVFGCARGADASRVSDPHVLSFELGCAGMLPPAFIEHALRAGAAGAVIAGCREGGCEFRLGQRWTAQRLAGEREPRLREAHGAHAAVWADRGEHARIAAAIAQLRASGGGHVA